MLTSSQITYLERKEIDVIRWNACIEKAENGLIYAYSYYLDAMCTNWSGLVLRDYEAVMPLPWRNKWGIKYVYQPYFISVLGIFGTDIPASYIIRFLHAIPKKFLYWDINLNEQNLLDQSSLLSYKFCNISDRRNYLLNIELPYEVVKHNYKRLAKRKLTTAEQNFLQVKRDDLPSIILQQYIAHYNEQHSSIKKEDYKKLELFCQKNKDKVLTYTASNASEDMAAFYLLFTDQKNIYSILGGSTAYGKEIGAFYFLTDAILMDYAGKRKTFRFEGSDIPGIAFFDSQFGPSPVSYYHIKRNNLPWPLCLLKK